MAKSFANDIEDDPAFGFISKPKAGSSVPAQLNPNPVPEQKHVHEHVHEQAHEHGHVHVYKKEKRTTAFHLMLTQSVSNAVCELAIKNGVSMNEIINKAISAYLIKNDIDMNECPGGRKHDTD